MVLFPSCLLVIVGSIPTCACFCSENFFDLFLLFFFVEHETERCSSADDRRLVQVLSFKTISGECNFCYSLRLNCCNSFSSYLAVVVEGRQKKEEVS